jgi:hypothetical protein
MRLERSLIESVDGFEPTAEMKAYYNKRTRDHITHVNKGAVILAREFPEISQELLARTRQHDRSKYSKDEYLPYVWMSWKRKEGNEKFEYPTPDIEQQVKKAIDHHMKSNRHHPEFHSNLNKMTVLDIAEMVCDWHAFHYEFGDDTRKWVVDNVGKRWKFGRMTAKLIDRYVEVLMK